MTSIAPFPVQQMTRHFCLNDLLDQQLLDCDGLILTHLGIYVNNFAKEKEAQMCYMRKPLKSLCAPP